MSYGPAPMIALEDPPLVRPRPAPHRPPMTALYFQRVYRDGAVIELCVANWKGDPGQKVCSVGPDGTKRWWHRREEGDLLVFRSPDDYDGAAGFLWLYDPRRQAVERMPQAQAERAALSNRVSA